jgi:hypothetical protein
MHWLVTLSFLKRLGPKSQAASVAFSLCELTRLFL